MNLGNIQKKENQSLRAADEARAAAGVGKGERLMRLQNEVRALKPGQTIQGMVVGRDGNSVQIELAQDFSISAKIDKNVSLALGQMLSFEIKANSSSFMSLAPLYTNTANSATILRALAAASMPETAGNIEMVARMMEEGMPIDKESILNMSRQIMEFPGQNPASIIQMTKLGLPVTAENIEQFEQYLHANHQILGSAHQIAEELPQVFQELVQEGQGEKALLFYEAVLDAFAAETGEEGVVTVNPGQEAVTEGGAEQTAQDPQAAQSAETAQNPEAAAQTAQAAGNPEAAVQTAQTGQNPQTAAEQAAAQEQEAAGTRESGEEGAALRQTALTGEQWEHLGESLRRLGVEEKSAEQVKSGNLPPKDVLDLIKNLLPKAMRGEIPERDMQRLLGGKEFQALLKEEIGRQWTIEPREVADKKQVEQLYERIREQTARLNQALDLAGKADAPAARSVQNLQNNVDFMNQMNHLYAYVQLPLKMLGNEAHGDLYVYTNKKNLAAKDGQVSALLHLDMEHLGPLDVYVTMKEKQVSTNFTVADEDALLLIEKHIDILNERLTGRGYSLKTQMSVKDAGEEEAEESIMQTLLHQQKNISVLSRTSFDMRA
ncbi:MAG: flagellar hook-length control protein FliK [Bacteroidales bacterium]|nr:flagellar hook-length control protein FliK [Bacteroidales bacterium]MCM1416422.1 flagellar hook-length control protein FliK [bacterium]MCM1424047.1 flagellar hook-length control protein FliK [bacterium]